MNLLYKREIELSEHIRIMIPLVGEILEQEQTYYNHVFSLTAMPIDMMVQLDDVGIDYTKLDPFELFIMMFSSIREDDTSLLFGTLDLGAFRLAEAQDDGGLVLIDPERDIVIDRRMYERIAYVLRTIHGFEKNTKQPGNDAAKAYMLERERKKMKRRKQKEFESQLEPLIVSMVNTQQFKYDYERTRELSIYQFNESVRQIVKKTDFDNRMIGVYTGNISTKDMKPEDMSWLKTAG